MRGAGAATGARIPNMIAPSAGRTCKRGLSSPSGLASVMLLSTAGSFVLSRRGVGLTVMNGLPLEVLGLLLFKVWPGSESPLRSMSCSASASARWRRRQRVGHRNGTRRARTAHEPGACRVRGSVDHRHMDDVVVPAERWWLAYRLLTGRSCS